MKLDRFILCVAILAFLFFKSISKNSCDPIEIKELQKKNQSKPVFKTVSFSDEAPEIKNKGKWINTEKDISIEDLKGKVVLIEFWTFGCYNCLNTLPYLNQWYENYKSDKFEMLGIHCPEFDNERNFDNVKKSVEELKINYPVLTDNEFTVWKKFDVHAWPTIFLIDKTGEIRYKKVGEGKYDKTESMIQTLLEETSEPGVQN